MSLHDDRIRFTMTEEHLKLARRMYVGWQDCEYGAPEIDPKRPYGNSDVVGDITEILGFGLPGHGDETYSHETIRTARELHRDMELALQIALRTGSFEAGNYVADRYSRDWTRIVDGEGDQPREGGDKWELEDEMMTQDEEAPTVIGALLEVAAAVDRLNETIRRKVAR